MAQDEIEAFAEWLWSPTFIIRAGKGCNRYTKSFTHAVAVKVPWISFIRRFAFNIRSKVIVKALVAKEDKPLETREALVALRLIKRMGFIPKWERYPETENK